MSFSAWVVSVAWGEKNRIMPATGRVSTKFKAREFRYHVLFFFSLLIFFIIIVIISMMNQVMYCQSFYGKSCVGKYNSAKAAAESNRVDKQQEVFAYVEYKSQ